MISNTCQYNDYITTSTEDSQRKMNHLKNEFIYQSDCEDEGESIQNTPDFSSHVSYQKSENIQVVPEQNYITTIKQQDNYQKFPSIVKSEEDSEFEMDEEFDTEEYRKDSRKSSKSKISEMTITFVNNNISSRTKKQSELKNANKYFMNQILNHLHDQIYEDPYINQVIQNLKGSGKKKQKSDVFNLAHYRAMFLNLDSNNINLLKENDRKLHSQVYGLKWYAQIPQDQIFRINLAKRDLFIHTMNYLNDLKVHKNKMLNLKEDYQEWINRIIKGISKMREGHNVLKF